MPNDTAQPGTGRDDHLRTFSAKVQTLTVEELHALAALLRRQSVKMKAELRIVTEQIAARRERR